MDAALGGWVGLGAVAAAVAALAWVVSSAFVRSGPDEWLLQVRDGVLVRGGVGITVVRWPQDRLVRFPAAVQRVRFEAEALTQELLPVRVTAFALWSVLPDDPLLAVRRLGLAAQGFDGARQHLLSRPQHHAFQQAFAALVRRHAGELALADLCREPAPLADAVLRDAIGELAGLGARVEGVQVIEVRPVEPKLLGRLSAPVDQRIAREAVEAEDQTVRQRDRLAAEAQRQRQLAQLAAEAAVEEERERIAVGRRQRAEVALDADIALARRRAESDAEIVRIAAAAEAEKPGDLRDHELARLRTQALSETLRAWPIREAKWVGLESPVQAVERILGLT